MKMFDDMYKYQYLIEFFIKMFNLIVVNVKMYFSCVFFTMIDLMYDRKLALKVQNHIKYFFNDYIICF